MKAAPIVTFYSVKGGVGRTLAALGVGSVLAGRGLRVLVIDVDGAAPGLSWLTCDPLEWPGVGDLLADPAARELPAAALMAKYSHECAVPPEIVQTSGGALRIMPVGRLAAGASVDLGPLAAIGRGLAGAGVVDIVLVDSGAGDPRAPLAFADHVVLFTALNRQHVAGTCAFLRAFRGAQESPPGLQFVVSPMPVGEDELAVARAEAAGEAFAAVWGQAVDLSLRIDYHPRLALSEEPHPSRIGRGALHGSHVALASAILQGVGLGADALHQAAREAIEGEQFGAALERLRVLRAVDGERGLASVFWLLRGHMAPAPENIKKHTLYNWLAEAFAAEASELAMFATELHRAGNPQALRFYERAVAAAPGDADLLGSFASFLAEVAEDPARAEPTFLAALAADRRHADNLGHYANFLTGVRGDHERAELCYLAAIEISPRDPDHLGNYANFLTTIRKDDERAEAYYRRAVEAGPEDPNIQGNFARLLFAAGRAEEGRGHLAHALELAGEAEALRCELYFYAYAHATDAYPEALTSLHALLTAGARSRGWDLGANVERARAEGHPEVERIAALARVIADEAPLTALGDLEV